MGGTIRTICALFTAGIHRLIRKSSSGSDDVPSTPRGVDIRRGIVRGAAIVGRVVIGAMVLTAVVPSAVMLAATPDLWTGNSSASNMQVSATGSVALASAQPTTSESASGDAVRRASVAIGTPRVAVAPSGPRPVGPDPATTTYRGRRPEAVGSSHPPVDQMMGMECTGCHESAPSGFAMSSHKDIPCMGCHEFPDSPNAHLLRAPEPQLCEKCHPNSGGMTHPTTPNYWDFHADEPLTCTSTCHDPHGSPYGYMLQVPYGSDRAGTDYLCEICHTQVGIKY
jgi:predicted CXXCH cytochrome family protein